MISLDIFSNKLMQIIPTNGKQKHLVAVSGGLDSMTLLFLLNKLLPGQIHATHCNYQLRGEESKLDEKLVTSFCKAHKIKLHKNKFDTIKEKEISKTGIQETARNLRYSWFEKLRIQYHYEYIFTAHHADDNAETILLNIARGSGLNGLKGISPINNYIVRPLLHFTKNELLLFAEQNAIPYRNDASNFKNEYKRNRLRNKIIPELTKVNSSFVSHLNELSEVAKSASEIINKNTSLFINDKCTLKKNGILIPIKELLKLTSPDYYLHNILSKYGFNKVQSSTVFELLEKSSGKYFFSSSHRLTISKDDLIIDQGNASHIDEKIESVPYSFINQHFKISFKLLKPKSPFKYKHNSNEFIVDADKINLNQLTLSSWNKGEKFKPFGMKSNKKLSDFFIDKKITPIERENALVLKFDEQIIAVLPYEIDNNFKVTNETKNILKLSIKKNAPN